MFLMGSNIEMKIELYNTLRYFFQLSILDVLILYTINII